MQLSANLAVFINPFLPFTAKKMIHIMKVVDKMLDWENGGSMKLLSVGYSLRPPELLFRKIEDAEIVAQIEKLNKTSMQEIKPNVDIAASTEDAKVNDTQVESYEEESKPIKPEIVFDDFAKIDLKVGTIVSAEKVPKADKLLNLQIDLGFEKRTILSGIAEHFSPEEIINKQVVVVANLAPRKMRGIESNGMIFKTKIYLKI